MCAGKDEAGVAKYDARITYATPTPGLAEVEPSMNWNPSVVAGIGVVDDPAILYNDMHSYLAESGTATTSVQFANVCHGGPGHSHLVRWYISQLRCSIFILLPVEFSLVGCWE